MRVFGNALIAAAATVGLTSAANAIVPVTVSATPGGATYTGPTPTFDFDTPATTPVTIPTGTTPPGPGPIVTTGTTYGNYAQPLGSSGNYFSAGPSTTDPSKILFGPTFGTFSSTLDISFIWGSIDTYNTLTFTDAVGNPLGAGFSFTGSQIAALIPAFATGNQTAADNNPIVTFHFDAATSPLIGGMQLFSNGANAFEIDNIAAVPEPSTWALMFLGFGVMGFAIRRRKSSAALTQLA